MVFKEILSSTNVININQMQLLKFDFAITGINKFFKCIKKKTV